MSIIQYYKSLLLLLQHLLSLPFLFRISEGARFSTQVRVGNFRNKMNIRIWEMENQNSNLGGWRIFDSS